MGDRELNENGTNHEECPPTLFRLTATWHDGSETSWDTLDNPSSPPSQALMTFGVWCPEREELERVFVPFASVRSLRLASLMTPEERQEHERELKKQQRLAGQIIRPVGGVGGN